MTKARRPAGQGADEKPSSGWRPPVFVLVLALLAPLMTSLPAVSAALRQPPAGKVFLGFPYMVTDHLQYASFVRQGEAGRLLMEDMFTTEPQRPSFILLYFGVVGAVVRVTGLAVPLAWELMRAIGAFGLMLAAWYFTGCFFERKAERILAYVMIGFSGGLGWLAGLLPEDLLKRPGYGFLTDPAHFQWNWSTFSSMLVGLWIPPLLLFLLASMLLLSRRRMPEALRAAGLFALGPLIWFFHPHGGNVAYFTIGLFGLMPAFDALWKLEPFPWRKTLGSIGRVLPYLLSFGVVVAYLLWASKDAVFAAGGEGAARWNPAYSVFWYPLTYGLLVPLAALGIRWCGSMPERPRHLVLSWLAAAVILSVNPLFSGVKYQFMVHLPLAVLSAHGIVELRR
ncbi:MAG TPA: hypothetical protein VNI57_14085, partial [Candidatus Saccharimonadales bacterium]|nr:hypothetical protein [Candidatus Saccharimonadales bacterium]